MEKMLQRGIKGIVSLGTIFIIMASPVAAIDYASQLMSGPGSSAVGEYTLLDYANSQQAVLQWLDKIEKWLL